MLRNVESQLDLNRQAAIRARNQAEGVFRDRLKSEEFKLGTLNNQYAQGFARDRYDAQTAARSIQNAQQNAIFRNDRNAINAQRQLRELDLQY